MSVRTGSASDRIKVRPADVVVHKTLNENRHDPVATAPGSDTLTNQCRNTISFNSMLFAIALLPGNPLAVFPEAEGITDETDAADCARDESCQRPVFVLPSDKEM
jgi:hypothetical protein